ncbi:adenylate/guanylate cyclase domain-containing protein [Labilibacter marinus]|uniref:adenylate/guanylate cyclase domain-containing protein n=1 Tax=Labilibacter marinus TaxID=1477105 RepID=UPI00082A1E85|nr:adenylate/guanylate cyclase domain-containing protein [Labilibacter marinus]
MFLREKLKIWFSQLFKALRYHFLYWNSALFLFWFLTGDASFFVNYFELLTIESIYANVVFAALSISILFTILDMLFSDRIMRYSPIRTMVFFRSLFYFAVALVLVMLAANKNLQIKTIVDYPSFVKYVPEFTIKHIRFFTYFYLACVGNSTFKEMYKKIGVGNFFNWFFGRLNKPKEEKKIFMFIDMKASTTRAEQLGHQKFSRLVQDVFNDMSVLYNYHGEIYNYLGDGAVVTFNEGSGLRNNNCLRAFFAFLRVIERRSRYYRRKYGEVPKFKAGLHIGKVMVLQVGSIRRDISYNGDAINTAARIESMCGEKKQDLLISGVLYEALEDKDEFTIKALPDPIKLKGKRRPMEIHFVKQKRTAKKKKKKVEY